MFFCYSKLEFSADFGVVVKAKRRGFKMNIAGVSYQFQLSIMSPEFTPASIRRFEDSRLEESNFSILQSFNLLIFKYSNR
jgi:hypothetical protein